jgi:hypothetical protein
MDAGQWTAGGLAMFVIWMLIIFGGLAALGMTMRKD